MEFSERGQIHHTNKFFLIQTDKIFSIHARLVKYNEHSITIRVSHEHLKQFKQ